MALISKQSVLLLLLASLATIIIAGIVVGPIPQPQWYHDFADQRSFLGIPNAWNVLSNIPFAVAGGWGLFLLLSPKRIQFVDRRERWPWVGVSVGLILTALGSGYYHMAPDDYRLVWDRLPMTIIFMSFVAALMTEKINVTLGLCLWPLFLGFGFYSVVQWYASELRGAGDLRLYVGVQIFTLAAILIMSLGPVVYSHSRDLVVVAVLFGLARLFEMYDHQIAFSEAAISGHTLKHLAAAFAGFWVIFMLGRRKIIGENFHEN